MTIGTAVPSLEEQRKIKHHFIQHKPLDSYYNAYQYEIDVLQKLPSLFDRGKPGLMVGGSGMYVDAVCKGIDDIPTPDPELRKELEYQFRQKGIDSLRSLLKQVDPAYYKSVDLRNHKRMLKGVEVSLQTGKPYSSFLTHQDKTRDFNTITIGLNTDREILHQRINKRTDKMMESGLLEEAKTLYNLYQHQQYNALNTVGYKELFLHLAGTISLDEAIRLIKRNTRRYARRQITWFKRNPATKWFSPHETDQIIKYIDARLE